MRTKTAKPAKASNAPSALATAKETKTVTLFKEQLALIHYLHKLELPLPAETPEDLGAFRKSIINNIARNSCSIAQGKPFEALFIVGNMGALSDPELLLALEEYRQGDRKKYQTYFPPDGPVVVRLQVQQPIAVKTPADDEELLFIELFPDDPPLQGKRITMALPDKTDKLYIQVNGLCSDMLNPKRDTLMLAKKVLAK